MTQPNPTPNNYGFITYQVLRTIADRMEKGQQTYGTPLQPFNGRDQLGDAIDEVVDLLFYLLARKHEDVLLLEFVQDVVSEYEKSRPLATATLPCKFVDGLDNLSLWLKQYKGEAD